MMAAKTKTVLAWFNDNEREWYYVGRRGSKHYDGPNPQCAHCGNVGYAIKNGYVVCVGHELDRYEEACARENADSPEAAEQAIREMAQGCGAQYRISEQDAETVVF